MDRTYKYLYEDIFRHFCNFCVSGNVNVKESIFALNNKIESSKDDQLRKLYEFVKDIVSLNTTSYINKISNFKAVIASSTDKVYQWWGYSFLCMLTKYIYPNGDFLLECYKFLDSIEKTLSEDEKKWIMHYEPNDYAVRMHISNNNVIKAAYSTKFENRDFKLNSRSFMIILKGFSSSTPFFYSALKERFHNIPIKGGGFFIKWKGYGIAIDPGINFMENMHGAGLNINDINAILVTHNHIDHNGDLSTIDDLASQFKKRDIVLYTDKGTAEECAGRLVNISEKNRYIIDFSEKDGKDIDDAKNIHLSVFQTRHIKKGEDDYEENMSYAVKLSLKDKCNREIRIGFTSDTCYFSELSNFLYNCDYIVANISETSQKDYFRTAFKDDHLGFHGCAHLITDCNANRKKDAIVPNVKYIISEFWAGKGDVRKELVKQLRRETQYHLVYPGDIGMLFFLDQNTFQCAYCGCEEKIKNIHIIKGGIDYSPLHSICDECIL